jgi:Arc/MetJ-type ribon-helix-helix transcriptional regulator
MSVSIVLTEQMAELVNARLATGRYASLEDLLRRALGQLQHEERLQDELTRAADEESTGRVIDFDDFDRQFRVSRGWQA